MKVLLAGGSGTLGIPLIQSLRAAGHHVHGIVRNQNSAQRVRAAGADPIFADVLQRALLLRAVDGIRADAVIHELTALKKAPVTHSDMAATNVLRIQGTTNLLDAARLVGARRFLTQSIVFGYGYANHGDQVLTEADAFAVPQENAFDPHLAAMRSAEQQAFEAEGIDGISLRYGLLYGEDIDTVVRMLRKRSLPVTRRGGELPFIHHRDAAAATTAALTLGRANTAYNIVDDTPATFRELLTAIARRYGAPSPLLLPRWLLHLAAPYGSVVLADVSMRVSNAKARSELAWAPRFASYRDGVTATSVLPVP